MYLEPLQPGRAYGLGVMQGSGEAGQFVRLADHDIFEVNGSASQTSFGVLYTDAKDGEMPTVFYAGGVYETDNFTGSISPDALLKIDATNKNLVAGITGSDIAVAQAISVVGGILRFKLLV